MSLDVYLPQDRRSALARGEALPAHTTGAALFADISGFTALTDALDRSLGARRGAEELSRHLNQVYDTLIAEIDYYGGAVISFAGDAVICWFDGMGASSRAAACALALQAAMHTFVAIPLPADGTTTLELKVAVASGPTRRLLVGNPGIQLLDALAGTTVTRMALGEHLAGTGEVLIDAPTVTALGTSVQIVAWRNDPDTGERFAVLQGLTMPVAPQPWSTFEAPLPNTVVRPWLLSAVYERHCAGLGTFLTELRPAVALFLRFSGIDFEYDPDAEVKLDAFIQRVQATLAQYEGTLLQLTIGDKGSYLYAVFGAPTAHEDDAVRAAHTALAWLRLPSQLTFLQPLQIGISCGVMRAGAYGGSGRRTYGVLGDEVNLAARLMQRAAAGEILISGRVQAMLTGFELEPLPPISLKGMPEPLPIFRLVAEHEQPVRLSEPVYSLPMIGRAAELTCISERLDRALQGLGQVVGISAEAGIGKSRLLAEVIRLARRKGMRCFGGACQSYGTNTPYLIWGPIWRAFFDLDPAWPRRKQARMLEGAIEDLAPERVEAYPLLGPLLGLPLDENDFTRTLEPQFRQSALYALLLDCLQAAAREAADAASGLLFVLEDLHWIDAASHDLLEIIAKTIVDLPVLIVLAYRPPEMLRLQAPRVEALGHFTRVKLAPLTAEEAAQVIRAKLAQLLPERKGAVTPGLITRITERAQGNPFYVEELLNYMRDRGIDPQDTRAIESLDWPASLHSLILSRIDQLSARQQAELKVASVIGRLFRFAWLHGAYPLLGEPERLKIDLEELAKLELTPLDTPEPELAYLFKHIVTQEVAYASLTEAARALLHEQLASYLEWLVGDEVEHDLDLLAYHYERSDNLPKKREYLWRAGQAAAAHFANTEAVAYLSRALDLTPEADTAGRYTLLLAREQVYDLQGARAAQRQDLEALVVLVEALDDDGRRAEVAVRLASYAHRTGDYPAAIDAAARAVTLTQAVGASAVAVRAYHRWAWALYRQGDYAAAYRQAQASLDLARQIGDQSGEAAALNTLGVVAYAQGDSAAAQSYYEQSLLIARTIGDRWVERMALGNLGWVALDQGNYTAARATTERHVRISREIGDRRSEGMALSQLGEVARTQGDYAVARAAIEQGLRISREIGDRQSEGQSLCCLGMVAHSQHENAEARAYSQEALRILQAIGDRNQEAYALTVLGHACMGLGHPAEAKEAYQEALGIRRQLSQAKLATEPLAGLAWVALAQNDLPEALAHVNAILEHLQRDILEGTEEPLRVYLTCYRVLQAAHDPRAERILITAYGLLQEQAAKLSDEAIQRMFLEDVPHHRELVAAWREQHT